MLVFWKIPKESYELEMRAKVSLDGPAEETKCSFPVAAQSKPVAHRIFGWESREIELEMPKTVG